MVCCACFWGGREFKAWTKESQGASAGLSLSFSEPRLESVRQGMQGMLPTPSWKPGGSVEGFMVFEARKGDAAVGAA